MQAGRRFRSRIEWHSCAAAGVGGTRPFAKNAKERGTHWVGDGDEIKNLGHPPSCLYPAVLWNVFREESSYIVGTMAIFGLSRTLPLWLIYYTSDRGIRYNDDHVYASQRLICCLKQAISLLSATFLVCAASCFAVAVLA